MSISIPAHVALGVAAKEYTIVDGVVQNVRICSGKQGGRRTTFRMRTDSTSEPETLEEFRLRVLREVADLQVSLLAQASLARLTGFVSTELLRRDSTLPHRRSVSTRSEALHLARQCSRRRHNRHRTGPTTRQPPLPPQRGPGESLQSRVGPRPRRPTLP